MADFADIATMETELALNAACAHINERATQARIKSEQFRLSGETRECDDCGEIIPNRRLIAAPLTTRCASCQEAFEISERQTSRRN